jgi:hypothetical protein
VIRVERRTFTASTVAVCDGCSVEGPRDVDSVLQHDVTLRRRAAARALEKGWLCSAELGTAWCPRCSGVRPGPLEGARIQGSWIGLAGPGEMDA